MRRALLAGACAAAALAIAGCALLYDLGTGGYSVSGEGGAGLEDCGADMSCPNLALGCLGSGDCDAGMVCCLIVGGQSSAQSACSAGPCGGPVPIQLCQGGAECAQGSCVQQTCVLGTITVGLEACGLQPLCTK
jgi:hypothetical protein